MPTHTVEALLVAMARKPGGYRDWPNVGLWLADACAQIASATADSTVHAEEAAVRGVHGVIELLQRAPIAAWARAAYFMRVRSSPTLRLRS